MAVKMKSMCVVAFTLLVVGAVGFVLPSVAQAQHSAVWKVLGHDPPNWPFADHQGAARRIEHAADYASDLQGYVVQSPKKPDPAVVKEISEEIGRNVQAAKKHFAAMKVGADKETVAAVEKIEKHLTDAVEHHKQVMDCMASDDFDHIKTMACCSDLSKELSKVITEHNDLMHSLAKKAAAKKAAAKPAAAKPAAK